MEIKEGDRFGRLIIYSVATPYINPSNNSKHKRYLCLCDCGKEKVIRESSLVSGYTTSCGCFAKERSGARLRTHGNSQKILFSVWFDMLRRCNNPDRKDYIHYGGRGISVCKGWSDPVSGYDTFIADMLPSYSNGLELDRIDVNGNYEPSNCRWVSRREQVINRRYSANIINTHFIEFNGKKLCISQWADELGIPSTVIVDRLGKLNWSVEKALTHPVRIKRIEVNVCDRVFNLKEIFKIAENLYYFAKKHKTTVQQLVADSLQDIGEVVVITKRQSFTVYPNKESTVRVCTSRYSEDFVTFIKQNGLEIK